MILLQENKSSYLSFYYINLKNILALISYTQMNTTKSRFSVTLTAEALNFFLRIRREYILHTQFCNIYFFLEFFVR